MLKFKPKMEDLLSAGLFALGVAQMVLGNKKEAGNRETMKNELKEEIMKEIGAFTDKK